MKSKKIIYILISVIAVILVVGIAVAANVWINPKNQLLDENLYSVSQNIPAQKNYTKADGEIVGLDYVKSLEQEGGTHIHYYNDTQGNVYIFDDEGELVSYRPNNDAVDSGSDSQVSTYTLGSDKILTEDDIAQLARQYCEEIYGEKYFSKFSLEQVIYSEDVDNYDVYFNVVYKEIFIAEGCIATLNADGSLHDVYISSKGDFDNFDPAVLEGVKEVNMLAYAGERLQEDYAGKNIEYEIVGYYVHLKDDGNYDISIAVSIEQMFEDGTSDADYVQYYYALE